MGERLRFLIVVAGCLLGSLVLLGAIAGTIQLLHQRLLSWMDGSFFIFMSLLGLLCSVGLLVAAGYEALRRRRTRR